MATEESLLSIVEEGTLSTVDSQAPLNSTAAAMLGLLAQFGPMNGNALSRCADSLIGDYWTLTRSQVYRELRVLDDNRFVTAGPPGPRSSRSFSITPHGKEALMDWLQVGPADEVIRMPILLTIRFGALLAPQRLRQILDEYSADHLSRRQSYRELETAMSDATRDPFEMATLRFGRLFEEAVEHWLQELPALLPSVYRKRTEETS
jgi:DNA-binding PadR family transcriptional regulator